MQKMRRAGGGRVKEAAVYRALDDDTRRRILALLASGPRTAGKIAESFPGMSRPAVSKHLALLREAALVVDRPHGRERMYQLDLAPLAQVTSYLANLDQTWSQNAGKVAIPEGG